ncbi:glycoside hydrolase family 25 protein [Actinomadura rugatobispora]|uniref:Glycoside hydrolase family 25 protein n=1 Tax=Actinomadura rugatobispora TaxID=1994 RepID=A0ABW1A3G1_9ACTN|nr:hypothetical protein GCM10010200_045100 [Actinomadura rugatobispora]
MPLYGVDVASYQGNPSWSKVHGSGIRFAFGKVTEDTDYTNPTWSHNRSGMLSLGDDFLPGAYHFLHGGDGAAQARYFLSKAGDLGDFAVALDVEASGANAATARDWVSEFKDRTGGHPVIGYFPRWYWDQQGRPDLSFFDTIWQSHYVEGTGSPSSLYAKVPDAWWDSFGGEPISVLQFTSSASVPGISGRCDANAYRTSLNDLRALALGTGEEDDMPIRTSLGKTRAQELKWGEFVPISWDAEYADPAGAHGDGDFPGYVAPQSSWADLTVSVRVDGLAPGDEYQLRYEVHDWKDGRSSARWDEIHADHPATKGAQIVTGSMSKGLTKGQHVYAAIAVYPAGPADGRPVPRAVSGRLTVRQDR